MADTINRASALVPPTITIVQNLSPLQLQCIAMLKELEFLESTIMSPTKGTFDYPLAESPEPSDSSDASESDLRSNSTSSSILTKRHDSGVTIPDQSFVQNDSRAWDIMHKAFAYLDAKSLARVSQTCKRLHSLIEYSQNSLWYNICCSTWLRAMKKGGAGMTPMQILSELESKGSSKTWKAFYHLHHNVRKGNYMFGCVDQSATIAGNTNTLRPRSQLSRRSSVSSTETLTSEPTLVATWPAALDTVLCRVYKNVIAWISNTKTLGNKSDGYIIHYAVVDTDKNEITDIKDLGEKEERHKSDLELILPNGEGQLVSFDCDGTIKVWDFAETNPKLLTTFKCQNILSLNVFGNRIVTGSRDGKIVVYSTQDGTAKAIFNTTLPSPYIEQLDTEKFYNVAMWEDVLVVALWEGTFLVINIATGAQVCSFNVVALDGSTEDAPYQPMTVVVSGAVLFINNTRCDEWIALDVLSGNVLYRLTRAEAEAKLIESTGATADEISVPSFDLKLADVSKDGTLLYGSVETRVASDEAPGAPPVPEERQAHLLVWDFRNDRSRTRSFRKFKCPNGHDDAGSFEFWVCYDE